MGWVVSVTHRPRSSPGERTPGTHFTGGWVGPRAGLDAEARGKILSPLPEIEPRSPGRPARSQTLYWLSYSGHRSNESEVSIGITHRLTYQQTDWSTNWLTDWGFFNTRQNLTTKDRRLRFHLEEVVLRIFVALKRPSSSGEFQPAYLGSNHKYDNN
jgi:hypothetical protein